mgnify:FL=1
MKYFLVLVFCCSYLFSYTKTTNENFTEYTLENNFDALVYSLEDEMINDGFIVTFKSDLGVMVNRMSGYLNKEKIYNKAIKIGFCKNSLGFDLMEENRKNIIYCPIDIVIYEENNKKITILYQLAKKLNPDETVPVELNKIMEELIEKTLEEF